MNIRLTLTALATLPLLASAAHALPYTQAEPPKPEIREKPIAGVYNKPWYAYLADVREAEQELGSDLRHASDAEDRSDAWEEYYGELTDADKDYVKAMRKRGYRAGRVSVG